MTEWTIILPVRGNRGEDITAAHATLRRNIAKTGGYSMSLAHGYWPTEDPSIMAQEDVCAYTFTRPDDAVSRLDAHAMAAVAKVMAHQEGVLVQSRQLATFDII